VRSKGTPVPLAYTQTRTRLTPPITLERSATLTSSNPSATPVLLLAQNGTASVSSIWSPSHESLWNKDSLSLRAGV